jgi:copper resistance protein B
VRLAPALAASGSVALLLHAAAAPAQEPTAPASALTELQAMSHRDMTRLMEMNDAAAFAKLVADQFEWRAGDGADGPAWDVQGWYGGDYNKLWFKTEGLRLGDVTVDARAELLWDRIFSRWWSAQAGVRHDFGEGPARNWLALGVAGLAPYFFQIEATGYVGDAGRTAGRFRAEYDLLLTQRMILQPEFELNAYGKDDPERDIGAGFSDLQLGLRVRYEVRRECAPYVGVAWLRRLGKTAELVRASGQDPSVVQFLAGIRFWL